ncbi:MAG: Sensor histidine kinase RcsC [Anaerolineae bacterium]|nr:Sensor histidine kinase RcsC [Anaerolineae bacterium]
MFVRRICLFALFLVLLISGAGRPVLASHKSRVLLISSYHPAFPTFFEQINGIKSVLNPKEVELDIEFMDSKRFYYQANIDNFYTSLKYKLSQLPPYDAILVSDDNALMFTLEHQAELFPQIPIVFLGVNNVALALEQNNNPFVTGIIERVSMQDTIQLMLDLPPHPTKIYAIVDDTPSGQGDLQTFTKTTQAYADVSFNVISLTDYTFSELAQRLQKINDDSAVLLLSAYRDRLGTDEDFDDSLQLITANLKVPLYHLWYHGMGDGILGGKIISHYEQGRQAAQIVRDVLTDHRIDVLPVLTDSPNLYAFDYRQMARFGITEADIPAGSLVFNRPESLYQTYRTLIWSVSVVLLVLLGLVALLSVSILKRRQSEQKLKASEQKYRTYINSAPYGVFVTDAAGQMLEVNPTAVQLTGYADNDLLRLNLANLVEPAQVNGHRLFPDVVDRGSAHTELKLSRPDGSPYFMAINAVKLPDDQVLAYGKDITDRKLAEQEIRNRNRELNLLNRVIAASAAAEDTKALLETVCRELALAFDVPQSAAALINKDRLAADVVAEYKTNDRPSGLKYSIPVKDNPICQYLFEFKTPLVIDDAESDPRLRLVSTLVQERGIASLLIIPLMLGDQVVGSLGVDSLTPYRFSEHDVNLAKSVASQVAGALARVKLAEERQALEEQYYHAQKMESLGRLTGGIAHDFNNLLTAINGFAEMIQMQLPPGHSLQPMVHNISTSGNRAAELVRQLLAFSRKQIIKPKTLDLNVVITDLERILRRLVGEDIVVQTILPPDIWPVKVDPTQIEQVIMNLVINARDAMPDGGVLVIETANVMLAEGYIPARLELEAGQYVTLSIHDNGCGISPEIQSHIFEPFFTTKEVGKGTGLGLSTVYGIVKQSGGDIQLESNEGLGTTFTVFLPKTMSPQASYMAGGGELPTGRETIMVVEDDPLVRSLICELLKAQGYVVHASRNGDDALRLAAACPEKFDLLLTDVIMPGMDGKTLSEKFVAANGRIKVLFTSGYTDDYIIKHGVLEAGIAFIQKPISPAALAHKVREVLDSAPEKIARPRLVSVE